MALLILLDYRTLLFPCYISHVIDQVFSSIVVSAPQPSFVFITTMIPHAFPVVLPIEASIVLKQTGFITTVQ